MDLPNFAAKIDFDLKFLQQNLLLIYTAGYSR
jgi:hypothetical protein